jgi:hypothetical protein
MKMNREAAALQKLAKTYVQGYRQKMHLESGREPYIWVSRPMRDEYQAVLRYLRDIADVRRFSDSHVEAITDELLTNALNNPASVKQLAAQTITDIHEDFVTRIYVPISGVKLEVPEFQLGGVRLFHMSEAEFANRIIGHTPDSLLELRQQRLSGMVGKTCAEVVLSADIDIAVKFANESILDAVCDFLQFAGVLSMPENVKYTVGVANDGANTVLEHIYAISYDRLQQQRVMTNRVSDMAPYTITASALEKLAPYRLDRIGNAIARPDRDEYDELLLRSVRWFAKAERDRHIDDRKLSYVTAIELFFSAPGFGSTQRICEGFALAMGGHPNAAAYMRDVYASRSDTSHEGRMGGFGSEELSDLRWRTVQVIASMSQRAFRSKADIKAWVTAEKAALSQDDRAALKRAWKDRAPKHRAGKKRAK